MLRAYVRLTLERSNATENLLVLHERRMFEHLQLIHLQCRISITINQ